MELKELKAEAKKHGYYLLKVQKYEKLEPCTCGYRKRRTLTSFDNNEYGVMLECMRCGLHTKKMSTCDMAKKEWNEMIRRMTRKS